jgi:hypothetical protein
VNHRTTQAQCSTIEATVKAGSGGYERKVIMSYSLNQLRGAWGAGKAAAEKEMSRPPLVGKYFHSIEDGKVKWQGKVVAELPGDRYLVQLFSWLSGDSTNREIINLGDMANWRFFSEHSAWIEAGDKTFQEYQP